jgi:hypothetical protein
MTTRLDGKAWKALATRRLRLQAASDIGEYLSFCPVRTYIRESTARASFQRMGRSSSYVGETVFGAVCDQDLGTALIEVKAGNHFTTA